MGAQGTPDTAGVLQFSTADVNECIELVTGCTDDTYCNYDPAANSDDGTCSNDICTGCMDDGTDPAIAGRPANLLPSNAAACNVGWNGSADVGLYSAANVLGEE